MKKLVLIGGGGHCESVADCITRRNYDDIIISDVETSIGKRICGIEITATDEMLPKLKKQGFSCAFITVGMAKAGGARQKICDMLHRYGFALETVIDLSACISKRCEIADGVFVGKSAVINAGARIGCCAIINTGAIIEHDCVIEKFSHIAPGCVLSGAVTIGENSHIGTGTSIKNGVHIGKNVTIGVGSAVVSDIPDNAVAYGVPCRVVK